jgi:hypothetical protein
MRGLCGFRHLTGFRREGDHGARTRWAILLTALSPALPACSSQAPLAEQCVPAVDWTAGTKVTCELSAGDQTELDALLAERDQSETMTTEQLLEVHRVDHATTLGYDPKTAVNLALLQQSALALDARELDALGKRGFVISANKSFPGFTYGYATLYFEDLPLYVSADSLLHAVHLSYDNLLKEVELSALIDHLRAVLSGMRAALAGGGAAELGDGARRDVDLYLAVAVSLLDDALAQPVAGALACEAQELFARARAAGMPGRVNLFGTERRVDFSQFKPRGHYTDSVLLERYFRAMTWLGRIDLRLIETMPDGSQVFHRRQLEAALAIRAVIDPEVLRRWQAIYDTVGAFVGEPDSMTLAELDALLADLGVPSAAELGSVADESIARAIVRGGYGTQRISSHIMVNALGGGTTLPLSSVFLLFGQRYVVDSHVFSNVVYDRTKSKRQLPSPLDVAFAALANDQASQLLADELRTWAYAPNLHMMRVLVDAHDKDGSQTFWRSSLYNQWLSSLRALSPGKEVSDPVSVGLPALAGTEPWGRRLLSTQLASWAQLRHDTMLYAKQSYTSVGVCEFPDAYVDPYPQFYEALARYAEKGLEVVGGVGLSSSQLDAASNYFALLREVSLMLQQMALQQRAGTPFTSVQMAFINDAVVINRGGCGPPTAAGWYPRLIYGSELEPFDPTIADVHTAPKYGLVLHVGTGAARLMVVTVNTCAGPRAYAGLASSYYELVSQDFQRLDDAEWSALLPSSPPDEVPWMADLVVP